MHSEKRSAGCERVHGRGDEGAAVRFGEVFLTHQLVDLMTGTHRYSKLERRWLFGLWLGKSETSDEHPILFEGRVRKFRNVRRPPDNSMKEWPLTMLENITSTPWDLEGKTMTMMSKVAAISAGKIVGARTRP